MSRNNIFCLMGKSASGKDTIYRNIQKKLDKEGNSSVKEVIPYTTRPIREGEENGKAYFFETDAEFEAERKSGKIIESRDYNTAFGVWHYYTKDDGQIDLVKHNYLVIGTLEAYQSLRGYYGGDHVVPLYIEVEDGERLQRALNRERKQRHPGYVEMCRRFIADTEDFSEERLREAGVTVRFRNDDSDACTERVWDYIYRKLYPEE